MENKQPTNEFAANQVNPPTPLPKVEQLTPEKVQEFLRSVAMEGGFDKKAYNDFLDGFYDCPWALRL